MGRLRLLRWLLPLAFIAVLVVVVLAVRRRDLPPPPPAGGGARRAELVEVTDRAGAAPLFGIQARSVRQNADGSLDARGIERLLIHRKQGGPLVLTADAGRVDGAPAGRRTVRLQGGIVLNDPDTGLRLELSGVVVDESGGRALSEGGVEISGPELSGTAERAVYDLEGGPTLLEGPLFRSSEGGTVTARRALLHDGLRDVTLEEQVDVRAPEGTLRAARLRVIREGRVVRRVSAEAAEGELAGEAPGRFQARAAEAWWAGTGSPERLELTGAARLESGGRRLEAEAIRARRPPDGVDGWLVDAGGGVTASGTVGEGPSTLRARHLRGRLGADGTLQEGTAEGDVRMEGPGTSAEAARAEVAPEAGRLKVVLVAEPPRKARLARDTTRVAADRIETVADGSELDAEGRVEAGLLPGPGGGAAAGGPLFRGKEAVHFLAERMRAREGGGRIVFTGSVRGWQGDRSVSGDRIELVQEGDVLLADGATTARLPRPARDGAPAGDVQVAADALAYRGAEGTAAWTGHVRVRTGEGWLESSRLDARLEGGEVREMTASEAVTFEFRAAPRPGQPPPAPAAGTADRATWIPAQNAVRLVGERSPATVRRTGPDGGTTQGRVLRYALDTGRLEVESGVGERSTIRSSGKTP